MILDAIVSAFLGAITALTGLLPSFSLPTLSGTSIDNVASWSWMFNRMVPLHYFVQLMIVTLALHLALVIFDGSVWIWHQVHGAN